MLSQNKLTLGLEIIRNRYYNALLKRGLAYYNGRIKNSKFIVAFEEYFPSDLLNSIGKITNKNDWILKLLISSNSEITYHPIRHLLLLAFLEMGAEEFFFNFEEFKPFGKNPYPCLNPASNHFGEFLINECQIFDNITKGEKNRGLPLGVFSCDCGFIYQRIGPDKSEEDKFKFNSVREYGTVWENKLSELWKNSKISMAKIAIELKTSSCKVVRHAIRLGLPEKFPEARQINGYKRYQNHRKTFSEMISEYRKQWLSILKNNPNATRQELMDKANFLYLWLRRNDSEWLEENLPPVQKILRKKELFNWEKIDLKLCENIKQIILEIRNEVNPLARISISEIIRRVGNKKWIDKRKRKLPLTKKLIDENLESLEDFIIRKIHYAKNLFLKEKRVPTRLQFQVRAIVRNKTSTDSERVQKEIDKSMEILRKTDLKAGKTKHTRNCK